MVEPGVHLWRSPHGYHYLRDATGTRDVTPDPHAARQAIIDDHAPGHPPDQ
jgi:hypothetical protein